MMMDYLHLCERDMERGRFQGYFGQRNATADESCGYIFSFHIMK